MRRTIQEGELEFIDRRGILMANLERQVSKKAENGTDGHNRIGKDGEEEFTQRTLVPMALPSWRPSGRVEQTLIGHRFSDG